MSDDERKDVRDTFIARLNEARRIAGSPSFKDIEIVSRKLQDHVIKGCLKVTTLPASTVHRTLQGPGRDLPKWRWVAVLIFVLRDIADGNGVSPDRVGTISGWKAKHETALAAMYDAALAGTAGANRSPAGPAGASGTDGDGITLDQSMREALDLLCRDAPSGDLDRLRAMAQQTMTLDWWREYRDVVPRWFGIYLSLEPGASDIRSYESQVIPGLLQTPAYAEAIIRRNNPNLITPQIKRRRALSGWRQQILYRPNPVKFWAIIEENVLRSSIDAEAMRAQISHLIDMCAMPNVAVQVVPADPADQDATGGPVTLLRFPQHDFPDVIYLEQLTRSLYPHTSDDRDHYGQVLNRLAVRAWPPAESIEVLHQIRRET